MSLVIFQLCFCSVQIKSLGYQPSLQGFHGRAVSEKELAAHFTSLRVRDGYVLTNVFFRRI
jgi:hypothetical protein